jgi:hypothetical protein
VTTALPQHEMSNVGELAGWGMRMRNSMPRAPPPHTPCSNPAAPAAESWKWSFQNFSLSGQSQVVILLVTNTYLCHLWCLYTCDSNCLCSPSHPLPPEKADFTLPRFCLEPVSAMMASSLVSADTNMADDNYLAGGYSALPK